MAVARASMAASITICTGNGAEVITLDADGNPVASTPCPDCSIAAVAHLPVPAAARHTTTARRLAHVQTASDAAPQPTLRPSARAPPPLA